MLHWTDPPSKKPVGPALFPTVSARDVAARIANVPVGEMEPSEVGAFAEYWTQRSKQAVADLEREAAFEIRKAERHLELRAYPAAQTAPRLLPRMSPLWWIAHLAIAFLGAGFFFFFGYGIVTFFGGGR